MNVDRSGIPVEIAASAVPNGGFLSPNNNATPSMVATDTTSAGDRQVVNLETGAISGIAETVLVWYFPTAKVLAAAI